MSTDLSDKPPMSWKSSLASSCLEEQPPTLKQRSWVAGGLKQSSSSPNSAYLLHPPQVPRLLRPRPA